MSPRESRRYSRPRSPYLRKPNGKKDVTLESEINAVRSMREAVHEELISLTLHRLRLTSSCESLRDGWTACSIPTAAHYFKVDATPQYLVSRISPNVHYPVLMCCSDLMHARQAVRMQVVAAHKGRLCSIFDGTTEYHMGKWLVAKRGTSWPPLDACYYAHSTPEAAVAAMFPRSSKLFKAPRVLLQVLSTPCVVCLGITRRNVEGTSCSEVSQLQMRRQGCTASQQ